MKSSVIQFLRTLIKIPIINSTLKKIFGLSPVYLIIPFIAPEKLQNLWFTQYFNGQVKRTEFITIALRQIPFSKIIETGTYLGNSTIALSCLTNAEVHTIEVNKKYFEFSSMRINRDYSDREIHLHLGDSKIILNSLVSKLNVETEILFLYLDAHWDTNLPLFSEVETLNDWGGKFLAVIDDFRIPDDVGYGYDSYGTQVVGIESLPKLKNSKIFTLTARSTSESGSKRGTGIIIHNDLIAAYSDIFTPLIREIS